MRCEEARPVIIDFNVEYARRLLKTVGLDLAKQLHELLQHKQLQKALFHRLRYPAQVVLVYFHSSTVYFHSSTTIQILPQFYHHYATTILTLQI